MLHYFYFFLSTSIWMFSLVILIIASMSFLFFFSKPISARALQRDLAMKPLEPTSYSLHTTPLFLFIYLFFYFFFFLEVPHICTSFIHEPLLHVPAMGLSIPISIFSLFCLKILAYLDVMMFGQYCLGTSILSLNQPLVPSDIAFGVLPSFGLAFTPTLTNLIKFFW